MRKYLGILLRPAEVNLHELEKFIEKALKNPFLIDVLPFLYSKITENKIDKKLNKSLLAEIHKLYNQTVYRNVLFLSEFDRLIQRAQGIPIIPLKGIRMLRTVYKDIGARELNDVDVLVKKEDYPEIVKILKEMGYRKLYSNEGNHESFLGKVMIEVHWHIVNQKSPFQRLFFRIEPDEIWENVKKEGDFFIMQPEQELIYLCNHVLKEGFASLKWLLDIIMFMQKVKIDFNLFKKLTKRYFSAKPVKYTFYLLKDFTDCDGITEGMIIWERLILENIGIENAILKKFLLYILAMGMKDKLSLIRRIKDVNFKRLWQIMK